MPTTLTQTQNSILNTLATGSDGRALYEISTRFKFFSASTTTISSHGNTIALIAWHKFGNSHITLDGRDGAMKDIFPKSQMLSHSRVYTTPEGRAFKWKNGRELYCVATDSGLNLATYYRTRFAMFRSKKSTLDIADAAVDIMDTLVVTWIVMEKFAMDRRREARRAAGSGGGP
ncbi:hypothetical protein BDV93DRAFT_609352 [Ceratobasidium sp. AG-I]|nr:hypothetical protein BDV93DRAFT_609352 [Ceratobasidium sp. AG-I]